MRDAGRSLRRGGNIGPTRRLAGVITLAALAVALPAPQPASAAPGVRAPEQVPGSYIVVLRTPNGRAKTDGLERAHGFRSRFRYSRAVNGFAAQLTDAQVRRLRADREVARVVPDRRVHALETVPVAAGDAVPAGVRRFGAATVAVTRPASSAGVAVVDTGIDLTHPDLNAVDGVSCLGPGPATDGHGHGTHVAGTVRARNDGAGVVGVAPGTRMYAVKVLDDTGGGAISQVICGIDWVTSTRTDADPTNDIAVANLSLGGSGESIGSCETTTDPMHAAICASTAAGVTYVVAAGNDGWDFDYAPAPDTPAAYPNVLTVTALADSDGQGGGTGGAPTCRTSEVDDRAASFSNFAATAAGLAHTIAAPGVCITSTAPGGGYATMSGTSMATPHVTGAVALCVDEGGAAGPCAGLTPAQIITRVRADAQRYTAAIPSFGFTGDPLRPLSGRHYGYLAVATADTAAPVVATVSPEDGTTGVTTASAVSATFNEAMDKTSTQTAFSLVRASDGATVSGSFSWSGDTMSFRPAALAAGTSYTARVRTSATDARGNPLSTERVWTFKTLASATAYPSATTITSGTLSSGSYSRLAADDNSYYSVSSTRSGTRTTAWYGRVTGVSNDLRTLQVTYKGRNSLSCSQTLSVWRWTTNSWVQLDARSVGTTEYQVDRSVSGTLADYVSGTTGNGDVQVQVRCTSASNFTASGDLLRVSFTSA